MCTLSWILGSTADSSYEIHFNRDERRTRLPADGPRVLGVAGERVIAPRDGDAGGSWIAVNGRGLSLCLLNRHHEKILDAGREFTSRGLLLLSMADASVASEVSARLGRRSLDDYQPFDLVVFSPGQMPRALSWNGLRLDERALAEPDLPVTSSSRDLPGVRRVRRAAVEATSRDGLIDSRTLQRLHASHQPERGVYSFCMHRDDARTVSYSRIRVDREQARFAYADGPPCETGLAEEIVLDLSPPSQRSESR